MIRIIKKSKSFSQKKRGYNITKSKNKFYSLLAQIDAIEKNLKRLKYALKMYSVGESNPVHDSIVLVEKYLDQYGDKIKDADKVREILEVVDDFVVEAKYAKSYNRIKIQKAHRRYSEKPLNKIKEAFEGFKELLELSPEEIAKIVEEEQKSQMRYDKIQRRNYDSSNGLDEEEEAALRVIKELAEQRASEIGLKMLPAAKTSEGILWTSGVGIVGGFILFVLKGAAFWPVILFFAIMAALSSLFVIITKAKAANLEENMEKIVSDIRLLAYRMSKSGKHSKGEIKKAVNYVMYGTFAENVNKTSKATEAAPELETILSRIQDLLNHYAGKIELK